jgi:hypothetical protein
MIIYRVTVYKISTSTPEFLGLDWQYVGRGRCTISSSAAEGMLFATLYQWMGMLAMTLDFETKTTERPRGET